MGKSIADLPDPLESASAAKPLENADDLLAQMAGEEVDRLLADAEAGGEVPAAPQPAADAPVPQQLDALFAQLSQETSAAPPAQAVPQAVAALAPLAPQAAPESSTMEHATSAAERQALAAPDHADDFPSPSEISALTAPVGADDAPLPAYLKPLEWVNAPLALLPQRFRDALGQVAILTLLNAIAVLIYVFALRKS